MSRFSVRVMRGCDLPAVVRIEGESFAVPWTARMLATELDEPLSVALVALDDCSRVVGFLIGRRYPDMWHVLDLAVAPGMRRQGIGGLLLDHFLRQAEQAGAGALLEVRESNVAASGLYCSRGFEVIGRRTRYYTDTGEDALVMKRGPAEASEAEQYQRPAGGEPLQGPLLAIESSCDDTAAAVLREDGVVLSSLSHSQDAIHERYGGVVPEAASRAHVERMTVVIREALRQAGCALGDLGGVAVTVGPGLIGALLVGVQTAKSIAWSRRLPLFPVNHVHGHLAAVWLSDPQVRFPMVTLVASGGHTLLVRVDDRRTFRLIGQTLDDAAGEAFDKGARLLGLGYPGGRELDRLAEEGDPLAFSLPVGLKRSARPDMSFSGVKTALYYLLREMRPEERERRAADIAASYREAIVAALVDKTLQAVELEGVDTVGVTGGVAANSLLRRRLVEKGEELGLQVVLAGLQYCTDNAAMVGMAALGGPRLPYPDYLGLDASASLALGRWLPDAPEGSS